MDLWPGANSEDVGEEEKETASFFFKMIFNSLTNKGFTPSANNTFIVVQYRVFPQIRPVGFDEIFFSKSKEVSCMGNELEPTLLSNFFERISCRLICGPKKHRSNILFRYEIQFFDFILKYDNTEELCYPADFELAKKEFFSFV